MIIRAFLVSILFVSGCAVTGQPILPTFHIVVDALAAPTASEKRTYVLLPGNEGVTWDDLQFQEFASYVARALELRGFKIAQTPEEADIAVVLFYRIGDPQEHQYSYSLPMWGKTGIASSSTYGAATAFGNTATYSGTTTYTPTYGITGYTTNIGTVVSYFRYVQLTAYDLTVFRQSQQQIQVWKTTITSTGSSGDLRRVFPVLLGAGAPYIGVNTGQQIQINLHETDDSVRTIKGQSVTPKS